MLNTRSRRTFSRNEVLATAKRIDAACHILTLIDEMPEDVIGGFVRYNRARAGRPYNAAQLILHAIASTTPRCTLSTTNALRLKSSMRGPKMPTELLPVARNLAFIKRVLVYY